MIYHSDKYFPNTTPTGWPKGSRQHMPNQRYQQQQQRIRRQPK